MMESHEGLRLPLQSPPVSRGLTQGQGYVSGIGVEAAQPPCANLTGLARDACLAAAAAASAATSTPAVRTAPQAA